ncbi:MAG TPA: putative toxin-antitoxin system toxin component, PIN family [Verrucomicrobiae bacterium]|nr:putative toxin-antitoxin system toxin component, PIN family [Verrucomicrobiae bacterium]
MKKKPRVVVDTNVLISALVFGGKPRLVIDLLSEGAFDAVVSVEILTELKRKILSKFPAFAKELKQLEKLLERDARTVKLGSIQVTICRDPDDNIFLETAVLGNCQYIVSGDKDLLVLESYKGIKVLKPAEFLELISKQP